MFNYFKKISKMTIFRYMVKSFTLVLPYFPTGTMERIDLEGQIATANVIMGGVEERGWVVRWFLDLIKNYLFIFIIFLIKKSQVLLNQIIAPHQLHHYHSTT